MKTTNKLILCITVCFTVLLNAQEFKDNFANESSGDIASQWASVKGSAIIGELDGKTVLNLDRYTVLKPVVNGQNTNYLGDQFTIEFDAYFDEVSTPTRQYYLIHLWDGTGVYGENGQHTDPYMIYRHGIRASGSFTNNKKIPELAVLIKTWRHIKVDYSQKTLKIFIDDQLVHHQPNLFYKPSMVSFSARTTSGTSGITNVQLTGNRTPADNIDGLNIILIVDSETQKVKNIELFETMQDSKQVTEKYPKSSFYAGVLNGKYAVRLKVLMDIEKPDWNNIISTGNYTIEPAENSVLSINTSQPYKPGDEFLPLKGARSFLTDQNMIPKDQFLGSDQFGGNNQFMVGQSFNLGIMNTKILQNKDDVVVFKASATIPIGMEPIQNPKGEIITPTFGGGSQTQETRNDTLITGGSDSTVETTGDISDPVEVTVTNPGTSMDIPGLDIPTNTTDVNFKKSSTFQSITKGNASTSEGYHQLRVIDNSFSPKNESTVKSSTKDTDAEGNFCVSEKLNFYSNSEAFSDMLIDGAPSWMKPGVFLYASKIFNNQYDMILEKRKPIKIYTNLTGANIVSSSNVDNPESLGNIQEKVRFLQSQAGSTVPANVKFKAMEVHSQEELSLKLFGKYNNRIAGITASLGVEFNKIKESHYYLIDMTQNMFSIDVESKLKDEVFINNENVDLSDMVYISRVNYGRRVIAIVESNLDMKAFKLDVAVELEQMVQSGELKIGVEYLNSKSDFNMKAIFYGGDPNAAFRAINVTVESQRLALKEYLESQSGNPQYALPIAYELKNLDGQSLGHTSVFNQTVTTCAPPIIGDTKLKITLTDLLCIIERDGSVTNPDDYGLQQAIYYKANNTEMIAKDPNIKIYPSQNCNLQIPYKENLLICSDKNNQVHVEGKSRQANINNSITFTITPEELYDKDAKMIIYTWLKEYTGDNDKVLENSSIEVDIHNVINHLINMTSPEVAWQGDSKFYDGTVSNLDDFYEYGLRDVTMWLRLTDRNTLEGPIPLGNTDGKGATWIHFELVD